MADIELVIKIPEELYEANNKGLEAAEIWDLRMAIKNGTPLPKGHGRLIDADKTISKICGNLCGCHLEECGHDEPCYSVARIIEELTIIPADKESEDT